MQETLRYMPNQKSRQIRNHAEPGTALNQELYLREFLTAGRIPLDNSDAERSIRTFCVGK